MEKFDIESIKDAVYELEGLLELAELREDKLESFLPLMRNKLKIINTLFEDSENYDAVDSQEELEDEGEGVNEEVYIAEKETPVEESPLDDEAEASSTSRPAFCINDRFRFRRELFNNSDVDFNATMDLVATMDDYDEAEAYFLGEREWDPEKEEVMDFMSIIRNYFEK